jgi:GR25 family glycosyltransferase involved in LPS biosynthesis
MNKFLLILIIFFVIYILDSILHKNIENYNDIINPVNNVNHVSHTVNFNIPENNSNKNNSITINDIKMYVISLKHDDRLENIKKQEDKIGTAINIFNAVKGDFIDLDELINNNILYKNFNINNKHRNREIGCYMSHLNIMKGIKEDHIHKYTFIFEDDFNIVCDDFMNEVIHIINKLEEYHVYFDFLYFGNLKDNHGNHVFDTIYHYDPNVRLWGCHGYLVNHRSIDKILDNLSYIDLAIDDKIEKLSREGVFTTLVIYPNMVEQNSMKFTSTIRNMELETFY